MTIQCLGKRILSLLNNRINIKLKINVLNCISVFLDAYWNSHWDGISGCCWEKNAKVLPFRAQCHLS